MRLQVLHVPDCPGAEALAADWLRYSRSGPIFR
jgi:hypothetical protein